MKSKAPMAAVSGELREINGMLLGGNVEIVVGDGRKNDFWGISVGRQE